MLGSLLNKPFHWLGDFLALDAAIRLTIMSHSPAAGREQGSDPLRTSYACNGT